MKKNPKIVNTQEFIDSTYPGEKHGQPVTPLAVDLLPSVFQTDTNKKIFSAAIEHMFQPAAIENLNYYVGKPSGSSQVVQEPLPRANSRRQFEAGLIVDTAGTTRVLTADDIATAQGHSNSHMLEPVVPVSVLDLPINPDKFVNWSNYYWLEEGMPTLYIVGPEDPSQAFDIEQDILGKQRYTLPAQLNGKQLELKNGMRIVFLKNYPGRTAITGNSSETHNADGSNQLDFLHEMTQGYDKNTISVRVNSVVKTRLGAGANPDYTFTLGSIIWLPGKQPPAGATVEIDLPDYWVSSETSAGVDVRLVDRRWQVTGVGTASGIKLLPRYQQTTRTVYSSQTQSLWDQTSVPWDKIAWDSDITGINDKHYVLQANNSPNISAFSRVNVWIHRDTIQTVCDYLDISINDIVSDSKRALRPIIEFDHRLELYNHGVRFRHWVDTVVDRQLTLVPTVPGRTGLDVFLGHSVTTMLVHTMFGSIENTVEDSVYLFDEIIDGIEKVLSTDQATKAEGIEILNSIVESFGNDAGMIREMLNNIILLLTDLQSGNTAFLSRRVLWLNNDAYKNKIITFKTNSSNIVSRYEIESANNGDAVVVRPACGIYSLKEFHWVNNIATPAQTRLSKTQKPLFRVYDRNQIALDQWEAVYSLRPNKLWSTIVEVNEGTVLDSESGYKFTFLPTQFRSLVPNTPQSTAMYDTLYKYTLQDVVNYLDSSSKEQQVPAPLNFRRLRSPITDSDIDLNGGLSFGYRRAWFRLRSWASNTFDLSARSATNDSVLIDLDASSWPAYEWNITYTNGQPTVLHSDNLERTLENILVGAVGENLVLNTIWVSSVKLINPNTGEVLLDKIPDADGRFKFAIPAGITAGFYRLKLNNSDDQILQILLINTKVDPRAPVVNVNGLDVNYDFVTARNLNNDVTALSVRVHSVSGIAEIQYQGEFISESDHATALPGIEYNSLQDLNLGTFSPGRLVQGMLNAVRANAVNTTEVWTTGTQIPALNGSLMVDVSDLRAVWLQNRAEPSLGDVLISRSMNSWRWYRKFSALLDRHYRIYDFSNETVQTSVDRLIDELSIGLNYSLPDAISGMAFSTNAMNSKQYTANGTRTNFEINTGSESFYQGVFGPDHVYVYVNGALQDNQSYSVVGNAVVFDSAPLNGAVVNIYHGNTELIYTSIPASPAKLGLSGIFKPQMIRETWGNNERILIQRHDGSKTLAYQTDWAGPADPRDQVILELENRVYTGCLYRNGDSERQLINRFTSTDSTATSPARSRAFLQWLNSNNLDYRDRSDFAAGDPWTWNYNGKSWRAIYFENFGTTQLHLAPWEALGYHAKPTWWDANYSWTDPVKRAALESALSLGRIGDPGVVNGFSFDFRVRRVHSLGYPVDLSGNLLDPVSWGMLAPSIDAARQPWELDSYSPMEDAWLRSTAGTWAAVINTATAIKTASRFVECNINPYVVTNQNNSPASIGSTTFAPNSFTQIRPTVGIGAVLFEANREINLLGESIIEELSLINPVMQFSVGGYADQTVRFQMYNTRYQIGNYVPEEDFSLVLNESVPVDQLRYSAVRLEKDNTGFRVYGFDPEYHYFTVYTPNKLRVGTGLTQRIVTTPTGEYVQWLNWNTTPVNVPYGTLFADKQSLYEFFLGISEYQTAQGLSFDQANTRGTIDDWNQAAIDSFEWIAENWSDEHYVIVSPAGSSRGFKVEHSLGQLDRLDTDLLRQGKIILSNNTVAKNTDLLITRDYDTNIDFIQPLNEKQILFAQIALRNYDHVFYFNNKTRFGDVLIDFQSNQRLDYLKIVGRRSRNWTGRMQAPGILPVERGILPGFDALVTDITESRRPEKSQYNTFYGDLSKSSVVPNTTSILSEVISDTSVEFQYRQGLKRATGTNLSIDAFLRNASIDFPDSSQSLNVNEQWLFKTGEFGRLGDRKVWEIELRARDVKSDIQAIRFIENGSSTDLQSDNIIDLIGKNDSRWITRDYQNIEFATVQRSSINKTTALNENWLPNAGVANLDQVKTKARSVDSLTTPEALTQIASEDINRLLEIRSFNKFVNYKPEDIVWHEGNLYKCTAFVIGGEDTAFDSADWTLFNSGEPAVAKPANIWLSDYSFDSGSALPADSDTVGWNVLQLVGPRHIEEVCPNALVPGLNESKVTFADPHGLNQGDTFLITGSGDGNYDKFHTVKEKVDDYNVLIAARSTSGAIALNLVSFPLKSMKFGSLASLETAMPPADLGLAEGTVAYIETEANQEYKVYKVENNNWVLDNEYTTENKSMVNSKIIDNVKILDAQTEELLATVEVFDPFKGLTIDEVAQYIDFNDGVDPAIYNIDDLDQEDLDATNPWGANKLGALWWDTSQVRYLEYEQGPIDYRIRHWGEQFEDSQLVVYEWTRTEDVPNLTDNPDARSDMSNGIGFVRYSKFDEEDSLTGATKTYYYYWKSNTSELPQNTARPYSALDIQATLNNPSAAGVTWMSPIDSSAFIVANVRSFLNARDSVIIRIEQKQTAEQQHNTGVLVSEGVGGDTIPEYLCRRLAAGVVGYDNYRKSYNLKFWEPNTAYKLGDYVINWNLSTTIQSSQYQSRDIPILRSLDATRDDVTSLRRPTIVAGDQIDLALHRAFYVTVDHVSSTVFKQDVVNGKLANSGASALYTDSLSPSGYSAVVESRRRVPDSRLHPLRRYGNAYVPVPQTWYKDIKEARRNLVYSANQYLLKFPAVNKDHWNAHLLEYRPLFGSYVKDITPYWSYVDYKDAAYVSGSKQILVNDHSEVQQYELDNDVEVVSYGIVDSNGVLQQSFAKSGADTTLIYQRNGTIQFNDVVWNGSLDGWDTVRWDLAAWDEDNSEIVENLLIALRKDLFVDEDENYFNLFFFDMVKESLRQIPNADWVTKTTYLNINNQSSNELRPLAHYYDRKNILVSNYINEVKPYHSKISDLNQNLETTESIAVTIEESLNLIYAFLSFSVTSEDGDLLSDENGNILEIIVNTGDTSEPVTGE